MAKSLHTKMQGCQLVFILLATGLLAIFSVQVAGTSVDIVRCLGRRWTLWMLSEVDVEVDVVSEVYAVTGVLKTLHAHRRMEGNAIWKRRPVALTQIYQATYKLCSHPPSLLCSLSHGLFRLCFVVLCFVAVLCWASLSFQKSNM